MPHELLKERNLPKLLSRNDMLRILQEEEYGFLPEKPENVRWEAEEIPVSESCAQKATASKVTMRCELRGKPYAFPFYAMLPKAPGKHPFIVQINFDDGVLNYRMTAEELVDNGFAVFSVWYEAVTRDNDDLTDGLAGVLFEDGQRKANDPGKIAMWAWAAQRVMDYAEMLEDSLDLSSATVCGHSRLGKTALLAAATDERFAYAYSNESGCSGAAISRDKDGESVKDIYEVFPFWFCENYSKYVSNEQAMPFDQHYLLASIAPRKVLVGSASEDPWACPAFEQLGCIAAAPAFEKGFVCDKFPAEVGDAFLEGDVGYHLRSGEHDFSRVDWLRMIEFVKLHQH